MAQLTTKLANRIATAADVVRYFTVKHGFFMVPLVIVLLVSGLLLAATGGLSYVAPFVYTLF